MSVQQDMAQVTLSRLRVRIGSTRSPRSGYPVAVYPVAVSCLEAEIGGTGR
jgi:hypothetical protein